MKSVKSRTVILLACSVALTADKRHLGFKGFCVVAFNSTTNTGADRPQ